MPSTCLHFFTSGAVASKAEFRVFLSRRGPETTIKSSGCSDLVCAARGDTNILLTVPDENGGVRIVISNATGTTITAVCLAVIASAASASDLNEGMQHFFDGKPDHALQTFNALIQRGDQDARIYYFRGLAQHRVGNVDAAVRDFKQGAELEIQGAGLGVGQALQRVQGRERLLLEKHRTMARLRSRNRTQPVAPKPQLAESDIQLTNAESTDADIAFRLASEIPLRFHRSADASDSRMLADAEMPNGPIVISSAESETGRQQPVGTGVATAGRQADGFDVFASEEPASPDVASTDGIPQLETGSKPSSKSPSVFGAVFRAFTKSTIPRVDKLVRPGWLPNASPPEPEFDVGDDVFGNDEGGSPFDDGETEDNPFGDN